jgi:starch phosphorylase
MYYFLPRALPEGLEALTELALDLRWTWSHAGDALWRKLDPDLWERTRSPWAILQNISQQNLEALARDPVFQQELKRAVEERERYLSEPGWCAQAYRNLGLKTIAYFSMEFGLSEAFPLYAGGLGILAGDYLNGERPRRAGGRRGLALPRGVFSPNARRERQATRGLSL